jgi:hypothetical protein
MHANSGFLKQKSRGNHHAIGFISLKVSCNFRHFNQIIYAGSNAQSMSDSG